MVKVKLSHLQELISQMQALQAQQQEETNRLRRRLEWLEQRRREFFEIVTTNSSDLESRRKLEETEHQLDEMQVLLSESESELKSVMHDIRHRVIALRNEELNRLEQEARALRERREEIRVHLLPAAQAHLADLHEEESRLGQRCDELMRTIRALNELDPSTIHQSEVA